MYNYIKMQLMTHLIKVYPWANNLYYSQLYKTLVLYNDPLQLCMSYTFYAVQVITCIMKTGWVQNAILSYCPKRVGIYTHFDICNKQ